MKREIIVGITGASGAGTAVSFLRGLLRQERLARINLIFSEQAFPVLATELQSPGVDAAGFVRRFLENDRRVTCYRNDQLAAPFASGSYQADGMVIVPCSMNTLAHVAGGISDRLISRAADVTLKERRPLLLAVRETPLNATQIENMLRVTRNGAIVFPICPAFYALPRSLDDVHENFAGRLLDHLDLSPEGGYRWGTADGS